MSYDGILVLPELGRRELKIVEHPSGLLFGSSYCLGLVLHSGAQPLVLVLELLHCCLPNK